MGEVTPIKKNGPFSNKELDYLRRNINTLTPQEMADELGRNVNTVISHLSEMDSKGSKAEILNLSKRADWPLIKKQLSKDEQAIFEWHWKNIVQQFKEEIYHTEGMQVVNAIKHEILANRVLSDQQRVLNNIEELNAKVCQEMEEDNPDMRKIDMMEKQISSLCMVQEANNREYRENSKKLSEILTALKGTREQRISKVEDSKTNWTVLMKRLLEDPRMKKDWGVYAEKMRLAKYEEVKRLGKLHRYENGEYDMPVYSSTTLELEKEKEDGQEQDSN